MVEQSKQDPEVEFLLEKIPIIFIPYVNIDGVRYYSSVSEREGDEIRKNMNGAGESKCKMVYERGVDINRNFDFNYGTIHTSENPCGEEYRG